MRGSTVSYQNALITNTLDIKYMTLVQDLLHAHQNKRLLRLSFPNEDGLASLLMVNRFSGTESISRDFQFTVELLSDDASIPLEAMQGKLLCISVVQANGSESPRVQ